MSRKLLLAFIAMALALAPMSASLAAGGNGNSGGQNYCLVPLPMGTLSAAEQEDLLHMRQEEKMTRDVYLTLYETWGLLIFNNIAAAEQTHMDSVKTHLDKYGLSDPVAGDQRGIFADPAFEALYQQLCQQGSLSLVEALQAGATIEDMDLYDLEQAISRADQDDLLTLWQNLAKGSRNHLRSFASLLAAQGITYQAQYLSQAQVDAIVASGIETGMVDASGDPVGVGQGPWWADQ